MMKLGSREPASRRLRLLEEGLALLNRGSFIAGDDIV